MNLYLVRHGDTALNSENRLRGWLDVPLNEDGIKQAEDISDVFKDKPVMRIYSSDLQRAYLTAEIIGSAVGRVPFPRRNFRPLNFGDMNGKKWDEIKDEVEVWIERWKINPREAIKDGDSFNDFQERNLNGLKEVADNALEEGNIIIATHLRNCLFFRAYADQGSQRLHGDGIEAITKLDHETGEAAKYHFEPATGRLVFLNHVGPEGYVEQAYKQLKAS